MLKMKKADYNQRLMEIVDRLAVLSEQAHAFVQPRQLRTNEPVPVLTVEQLREYGGNYVERTRLPEELRKLANEKVED